jgi:hypothetical protein
MASSTHKDQEIFGAVSSLMHKRKISYTRFEESWIQCSLAHSLARSLVAQRTTLSPPTWHWLLSQTETHMDEPRRYNSSTRVCPSLSVGLSVWLPLRFLVCPFPTTLITPSSPGWKVKSTKSYVLSIITFLLFTVPPPRPQPTSQTPPRFRFDRWIVAPRFLTVGSNEDRMTSFWGASGGGSCDVSLDTWIVSIGFRIPARSSQGRLRTKATWRIHVARVALLDWWSDRPCGTRRQQQCTVWKLIVNLI